MAEQDWGNLPQHILLQIFQQSSLNTIGASAQVCHCWNTATQVPSLWRSIKLILNERELEKNARRVIALTNKCAKNVTKLKVECNGSVRMNHMLKTLKTVFEILSRSRPNLKVFELQGLYQDYPTNTEMTTFVTAVNTFLEQQKNLEKFVLEGTDIEEKYVKSFLEILGTSSGEKMKIITLNYNFIDGPIDDFNTILKNFRNLHRLDIGYINQQLIENLSNSLGTNFTQLFITVEELEASISDTAWVALKKSCPDLVVSFYVNGMSEVVLLTPSIPLISITAVAPLSHEFEIANIATLYQHTLEELHIENHFGEQELSEDFCKHLASFQRLRKFSMSMMIKTEANIKFLRAFGEVLKRPNSLTDVKFKYRDSRTIGSKVLKEIEKLKEESVNSGLLLNVDLLVPGQDYF
ncbi:F-box/LRR-repeat protein 21-like [Physella acuta]|uniref:F-box/LRR-repeat protein 21-like n=1 Tax=Physella acuta TaxID=109671 RepID=UPI0027DB74BD|nr:F-box/LRR-repeat protein 21-like [Physella acuta]